MTHHRVRMTHEGASLVNNQQCGSQPYGIVLFGAPGCGKGTVGKAAESVPGVVHCSSGDLIRSAINRLDADSDCRASVDNGSLAADSTLWRLFDEFLASQTLKTPFNDPRTLVVIDGIPRRRSQVQELARRIDVLGVFYLECSDSQVLLNRLVRRSSTEMRADDSHVATIEARLKVFYEETLPALEEYDPAIVHRIDATQPAAEVLSDVLAILHLIRTAHSDNNDASDQKVRVGRHAECLTHR